MIEHFPSLKNAPVFSNEDVRHHTRLVAVQGARFAQRAAEHYTALLLDRTLKQNNQRNGYFFCLCVYDAFVAAGIAPERIAWSQCANPRLHDAIDLVIAPSDPTREVTCFYVKPSLRERWKHVDRDARIAKDIWGNRTRTICLAYSEDGARGFRDDLAHASAIDEKFLRMEACACGVDVYAALSQPAKVNALIPLLLEGSASC